MTPEEWNWQVLLQDLMDRGFHILSHSMEAQTITVRPTPTRSLS